MKCKYCHNEAINYCATCGRCVKCGKRLPDCKCYEEV